MISYIILRMAYSAVCIELCGIGYWLGVDEPMYSVAEDKHFYASIPARATP